MNEIAVSSINFHTGEISSLSCHKAAGGRLAIALACCCLQFNLYWNDSGFAIIVPGGRAAVSRVPAAVSAVVLRE